MGRMIKFARVDTLRVVSACVAIMLVTLGALACSDNGDSAKTSLRDRITELKIEALDTGPTHSDELFALGQALFFDPILSGNRDISCATCHHPDAASGDALPVSIGTGGTGLAADRQLGASRHFVPRNATELFNRGAPQWHTMFWDRRIERDGLLGISSPAGEDLPTGLPNVLVAQAMFPVTSRDEMLGDKDEASYEEGGNELAFLDDEEAIWEALMVRLLGIDGYVEMFTEAFPEIPTENLTFVHVALAIAAFESDGFAFADSPWDRYVAGEAGALSEDAISGGELFFGRANCATCHSGPLFTDQEVHNIASPQTGPGKAGEAPDDFGRFRESFDFEDLYRFRTPPLRNVELTGPWFHSGAYTSLEEAVAHHLDPLQSLEDYAQSASARELASLYEDEWSERQFSRSVRDETGAAFEGEFAFIYTDEVRTDMITRTLDPVIADMPELNDDEIAQIVEFLKSLTDPAARDLSHLVPESVPSGLPLDE